MLKWICAVALAAGAASPAFAQKPKDSPPKMVTPPDVEIIREGMRTIKQTGECNVTFVVGEDGKTKDHKADCTVPEYAPFAIRAMQSSVWEPEILDGEKITSLPKRQPFKFASAGPAAAPDPRGEKAPVQVKGLDGKEIERIIQKVGENVERCDSTFTVGVDGKPKDIVPNCKPQQLNPGIIEAIAKMEYTPGQKGGQPVEWPNMQLPMNLAMTLKQN